MRVEDGVEVCTFWLRKIRPAFLQNALYRRMGGGTDWIELSLGARAAVRKLRREGRADVVLATHLEGIAWALARLGGPPVVTRISGFTPVWNRKNFEKGSKSENWRHRIEHGSVKCSARVFSPSGVIANMYREETGREIPVIRTPMFPLAPPTPGETVTKKYGLPDRFALFYSGYLGMKGAHVLCRALQEFMKRNDGLNIVMVGRDGLAPDGKTSMKDWMRSELAGFGNRIRFLGYAGHEDLFGIVASARFIVAPSLIDNLPNVLMEGMYFSRVVIGTRGASFDEIIEDGVDGILVERDSVDSLADGLNRAAAMTDAELASMGARAKEKASRLFDPDTVMNQMLGLCRDAITA